MVMHRNQNIIKGFHLGIVVGLKSLSRSLSRAFVFFTLILTTQHNGNGYMFVFFPVS